MLSGVALIGISLAAARAYRLGTADLGFDLRHAPGGAAVGGIAAIIALAGVVAMRFAPVLIGQTIAYDPVERVPSEELVRHLAFFLPLGAVLPEEIAFRGTLLGALAARYGARVALLASAATFAMWHGSVIVATVGETTIAPPSPWSVPATLGALAVLFGGGLLFAGLRLKTGTIASTIVAHWAFNAVVLLGLRGVPS